MNNQQPASSHNVNVARALQVRASQLEESWGEIEPYVPEPMPWEVLCSLIRNDLRAERPIDGGQA